MTTPALLEKIHAAVAAKRFDELETLLLQSPEARRLYLRYTLETVSLRRWAQSRVQGPRIRDQGSGTRDQNKTSPMASPRAVGVALAATILLAVTAWFALPDFSNPQSEIRNPQSFASVATLTNIENAAFADTPAPMNLGGSLPAGPIQLTSGTAQIMFASTAVVDLTGPCEFEMTGPNRGKLTAGTLEAFVPESASGFTVDLPGGARVVDLGTRFSLLTRREGDSFVRVHEGRVRLQPPSGETEPVTIHPGQGAQISPAGHPLQRLNTYQQPQLLLFADPLRALESQGLDAPRLQAGRLAGQVSFTTGASGVTLDARGLRIDANQPNATIVTDHNFSDVIGRRYSVSCKLSMRRDRQHDHWVTLRWDDGDSRSSPVGVRGAALLVRVPGSSVIHSDKHRIMRSIDERAVHHLRLIIDERTTPATATFMIDQRILAEKIPLPKLDPAARRLSLQAKNTVCNDIPDDPYYVTDLEIRLMSD